MKYEWDDVKASKNYKKHGIRFEEAQVIWADMNSLEFYDDVDLIGEDRFIRIGLNAKRGVLHVVYTERENGETIRIISARKASNSEKAIYEEELRFKIT